MVPKLYPGKNSSELQEEKVRVLMMRVMMKGNQTPVLVFIIWVASKTRVTEIFQR